MKKFPVFISKRNEYSLFHFNIRYIKDTCLYDDVEDFFAKHNLSSNIMVDRLINQSFTHARYTDHDYPL
jgi:hypothetical protein